MNLFPYSNFHDINLDWIMKKINEIITKIKTIKEIPPGGTTGQSLVKRSNANYDVEWFTVSGGGGSNELYYCTYGTTTNAQIETALANGLLPVCKYQNKMYYLTERISANQHLFNSVYRSDSYNIQVILDSWILINESFATALYVNNQIAAIPNLVPAGGNAGEVLAKASNTDYDLTWVVPGGGSADIEWVTYGTTTSAVIEAAYQAGKIVACLYNNYVFYLTERTDDHTHYFMSIRSINSRYIRCYNNSWTFANSTLLTQTAAHGMFVELPLTTPNAGDVITWTGTEWDSAPLPVYNGGVI